MGVAARIAEPGVAHLRFRWRSWLGAGVSLFLLWGLVNVFSAVFVPLSLHLGGAAGLGGMLVWSADADAQLLGRSIAEIGRTDAGLSTYLVTFMDTMCAQMMSFGILQLAIAWYALRRAHTWALWSLLVAGIAFIPYNAAIWRTYAAYGVASSALGAGLVFSISLAVIPLAAFACGWLGLKRIAPVA